MTRQKFFRTAGLSGLGVVLALSGLTASGPAAEATPDRRPGGWRSGVESWVTDFGTDQRLSAQPELTWQRGAGPAGSTITVDPTRRYQRMTGFGASMTDSSAYVLTKDLSADVRAKTMRELFSTEDGIGLSMMRQPMGASDFAVGQPYSYDEQPKGQTDPRLKDFSIEHDEAYILPRLREAYRLNPDLSFMATPWSAPGWMKTSDSMVTGSLKPEYEAAYARYFTKFIKAYRAAGIPTDFVSANNEPLYAPDDYPGMYVLPDQAASFIGDHLGPELARQGLARTTTILGYDHNWDVPVYPESLYANPATARYVPGTAWHCYAGEVVSQSVSHNNYPHAQAYETECSGGSWQSNPFALTMASVIGVPRNWGQSVVLWNLALDEKNGPFIGGCDTCRGVVSVRADGTVTKNVEYYALGHAAKFVQPGAVRIGSSALGPSDAALAEEGVSNVAYANPDGSQVLVAFNAGAGATAFSIQVGDRHVDAVLAPGAAATYRWHAPAQLRTADVGYLDLDLGRGPAGTPTGRLTQTVTNDVVDALTQVKVGDRWLGYSLPAGAVLERTGTATTLPQTGWTLTADGVTPVADDPLVHAIDGDLGTRWSSGTGQTKTMGLTLDLGAQQTFSEIELNTGVSVSDFLRRYIVATSPDGQTWTDVARGAGTAGTSGVMTIALPPTTTRYLRLQSNGEAGSWWSVAELNLRSVTGSAAPSARPDRSLARDCGRLPDHTLAVGWYNRGRRAVAVPWPIGGFAYRLSLPPTAATTLTVR